MSTLKSAFAAAILAVTAHAGATVIDFNGTSAGGYSYANGTVLAGAFQFTAPNTSYFMGTGYTGGDDSSFAYNGTDYLMSYSGMTFARTDSAAFSVQSLDMKDWAGGVTSATLTGNFASGGSIVLDITLGATSNWSSQSGNDFTNYALSGFTGLSSFSISSEYGYWLAIDNLTINAAAVPEPGTLAVFGLGLAALAAMRRRKQK